MVERINNDRADVEITQFSLKKYLANALDTKVWAFGFLFCLTTTQSYAIAYFLPVILSRSMGFSIAKSQCLVATPYAAAAICMYGAAMLADKYRMRAPFIIFFALVGLTGLPMLGYSTNSGVRYFGVFLATISANANIPAILTYQANNIRGSYCSFPSHLHQTTNTRVRTMEACLVLRDSRRLWWYRWNHRQHRIPRE